MATEPTTKPAEAASESNGAKRTRRTIPEDTPPNDRWAIVAGGRLAQARATLQSLVNLTRQPEDRYAYSAKQGEYLVGELQKELDAVRKAYTSPREIGARPVSSQEVIPAV